MNDPLLRDVALDHTVTLPVLGITTSFASNDRAVRDLVGEAFGGWSVVRDLVQTGVEKRVRIVVIDSDDPPSPVRHIALDASRLAAHSAGGFALSDPDRGEAVIYASRAVVADRGAFRTAMLEAMTMALLCHFDRHPVHAAAIARNGRAILLAGASGAGKSTLAHLAHDAGADVMSEDTVWIQREPRLRVWGRPGHARLLTGAAPDKVRVPLGGADRASCYVADAAVVCLLRRGRTASLERVDAEAVREALDATVAPGFDRFPDRQTAVARALAGDGGWQLTTTSDPQDAMPLLEQLLNAP